MPAGTFLPPGLTTSNVKISGGGTDNYVMTAVDSETIQGEANLTFDGTDLTIASGSIQVRTIDYSDGDRAMTIADGGGVTFDDVVDFDAAVTFGANDTGVDVIAYGDTADKYMFWDTSDDELKITGGFSIQSETAYGTNSYIESNENSNASAPSTLILTRSRGTNSSKTIVATGDSLGRFRVRGWDGGSNYRDAAYITGVAGTGTQGTSSMPGRLQLYTSADGYTSPSERMLIQETNLIKVGGGTSLDTGFIFDNGGTDYHVGIEQTADDLVIGTGTALGSDTAITIDSNKKVGIGAAPSTSVLEIQRGSNAFSTAAAATDVDNIFLKSNVTQGDGVYGPSIAWARVSDSQRRKLAIVAKQDGADDDDVGMAIFTNPGPGASAMVERLEIGGDGQFDFKSNALGITNVGASGNDWDATGLQAHGSDIIFTATAATGTNVHYVGGNASKLVMADDESFTFSMGNGGLFTVTDASVRYAGVFAFSYASSTIVEISDPDSKFVITDSDTGSKIAVFTSSNSHTVTVKNYTGGDTTVRVYAHGDVYAATAIS